jgi:8-oxo-dGTP pyrophosphatase MutT (NUDIX family)
MALTENPWQTLSTRTPYENPWLRVDHHEVLNPAGKPGIYGVVHFKNHAIGIVPVDDEGYTWLVGQYRYALGNYEWEIPEGGCPVGTDPLVTAQRELKEETGLVAITWSRLLDFHLSNSVTNEYGVAYLARGLTQESSEPEETEDLTLRRLPLQEAIAMTLDGRIKDALSIMALQRVALLELMK